jgi:DNA-binding NarL/FixJ family response regulator
MKRIAVLLVDDHTVVRQGLRALIKSEEDIEVVGEAENGRQAVTLAQKTPPDVVVMDVAMPELNGIEATRRLTASVPHTRVIALSMHKDSVYVREILRAGARGYLLKDADKDELVRAIVAVERGGAIFSPAIAQRMIQYFTASNAHPSTSKKSKDFPELTERELEILDFIAQGHNNTVIANKLSLSIKTVQNYVSSILTKLQVADRAQAIVRAREAGFGKNG